MDTHLARKAIDRRLEKFRSAEDLRPPHRGWIRAIRDAMGMSSRQLAERMQVTQPRITKLEQAEVKGSLTLASLEKAADALNCTLVYALVPRLSLEEMVQERARIKSATMVGRVHHTMALEAQTVSPDNCGSVQESLANELLRTGMRQLWDNL